MAEFKRDYKNPELVKMIYDMRTAGEPFLGIQKAINEKYNLKISSPTCKAIYERYVAKQLLINSENDKTASGAIVDDYQSKMEKRFDKIAKITDELMDLLQDLKKNMPPEQYAKYVPTVLAVSREILNQLNFIKREQSNILINQKNMIYSPLQIMNVLNKEIVKLENDRMIKIQPILGTKTGGRVFSQQEKDDLVFTKPRTDDEIENESKVESKDELEEEEDEPETSMKEEEEDVLA